MTTFHIGCAGFTAPRERYQSRLHYVEYALRPPIPSPKVLAGWKKHRPEGFEHGLVASPTLWGDPSWPLRDQAALRAELDRLANQVDALGARVLVLRTPMAVSPGSVALGRFTPVLERARKVADVVVWDPSGPWEPEAARAHASAFGVVVACDPLHDEVQGPVVYARMRGLGFDHRYHVGRLEEIVEKLSGCDEAWVVFESSHGWREACGLQGLVAGLGADALVDEDEDEGDEDEGDDEGDEDEDDEEDD